MNTPYVFKKCGKCGIWWVAYKGNFSKKKGGKYGLRGECKKCIKRHNEEYYQENADKIKEYGRSDKRKEYMKEYRKKNANKIKKDDKRKEYMKEYRKKNVDKIRQRDREYYQKNADIIIERKRKYMKEYYQKNAETIRIQRKEYYQSEAGQIALFNGHSKRREKEENQGGGIAKEQWREMMDFFNWRCAYSDMKLSKNNRSIDHIIALNDGGLNEIWNCVPMYKPYNSSKKASDMLVWYQQQDFYSEERLQKIYEWQEYAYNKWGKEGEVC